MLNERTVDVARRKGELWAGMAGAALFRQRGRVGAFQNRGQGGRAEEPWGL